MYEKLLTKTSMKRSDTFLTKTSTGSFLYKNFTKTSMGSVKETPH